MKCKTSQPRKVLNVLGNEIYAHSGLTLKDFKEAMWTCVKISENCRKINLRTVRTWSYGCKEVLGSKNFWEIPKSKHREFWEAP